jgi:hypothetical protein
MWKDKYRGLSTSLRSGRDDVFFVGAKLLPLAEMNESEGGTTFSKCHTFASSIG